MSAASSACAAASSLPRQRMRAGLNLAQRLGRFRANLGHRRAAGQPDQPFDERARRRAPDFLFVWGRRLARRRSLCAAPR